MPTVLGLGEGEGFLSGSFDLLQLMNPIMTEKPAIYVVNVRVTTCAVSFVVDNRARYRDYAIGLHELKLLIFFSLVYYHITQNYLFYL